MKISILFFFLTNSIFLFPQDNVYIIINESSVVKHMKFNSDTIQLDSYFITLSPRRNKITFSVDKGKLKKKSETRAYNRTTFDFIYQNTNGNNNPILIKKDSILNQITYDEMIMAKNYQNLLNTLKEFKNVFIIEEKSFFDGYYIAKKIETPRFLVRL